MTNRKAASAKSATKAKAPKINPDAILSVASARTGNGIVVTATDGQTLVRPANAETKEFKALAMRGASFKRLATYCNANPPAKPQAKLARGIGVGDAPHSAKAVSDARGKAATPKATGKGKPRTDKAPKAKQPSAGTDRAYTKGSKKDESKPGTWRNYMLTTILANKTTASAKAAHAASKQFSVNKLDFNWANAQGYIVLK